MSQTALHTDRVGRAEVGPKLGLGTVQFGLRYGLSKPHHVPEPEVRAILASAWSNQIDLLDTAPAYGSSEEVISAQWPAGAGFAIVTKALRIGEDRVTRSDVDRVIARARLSVERFGPGPLYGLLIHESNDLLVDGGEKLFAALRCLREEGGFGRLGVSVYHPDVLLRILERFPIDMVQVPLNAIDQRFARSGLIADLASRGIEVHVRSVFLQGFLISEESAFPRQLQRAVPLADRFRRNARMHGLDPAAAALLCAVQPGVSRIIIGVDSMATLQANLQAFADARAWRGDFDFSPYALDDANALDPRRWTM